MTSPLWPPRLIFGISNWTSGRLPMKYLISGHMCQLSIVLCHSPAFAPNFGLHVKFEDTNLPSTSSFPHLSHHHLDVESMQNLGQLPVLLDLFCSLSS
ncbi:hypothetical protein PILCRDRAFT_339902 [Piloderma croceum F 1598]|uniref:Uncharacterized protein n=1 Tax=Piloderma croceum (strain F 1598) TaxID=765440 RepID=A0A0C3FP60_PILCF|nr:hypothetical protein PILCRDRAFT_339902 [Piloderma croceum F 1598]